MTDITLTDMEDLQTKIDDYKGDTYLSYSDQLAVYTGAISGTGLSTDDKDWTNAVVTSVQPGNTSGSTGVDSELASFLKDEYFATASASLEQYKNDRRCKLVAGQDLRDRQHDG